MRQLILMRHAKAETAAGAGDHARPLSPRGRAEAAEAGRRVAARARPDFALVSDSLRTRQTLDGSSAAFDTGLPHRATGVLYAATADAILREVRATADAVASLLVIGHNPGIADLARRLAGRGAAHDLARLARVFPTSCFAVIHLDAPRWEDAGPPGELTFLLPADERSGA
jgi:phosphohistidine phosphatase